VSAPTDNARALQHGLPRAARRSGGEVRSALLEAGERGPQPEQYWSLAATGVCTLLGVNVLEIVVLAIVAVVVLAFLAGMVAARRRAEALAPELERHLAAVERRLAEAQAADPTWRREVLEAAARRALRSERPELADLALRLVRVHDAPGAHEDEAEFEVDPPGADASVRIRVARQRGEWEAEIRG